MPFQLDEVKSRESSRVLLILHGAIALPMTPDKHQKRQTSPTTPRRAIRCLRSNNSGGEHISAATTRTCMPRLPTLLRANPGQKLQWFHLSILAHHLNNGSEYCSICFTASLWHFLALHILADSSRWLSSSYPRPLAME